MGSFRLEGLEGLALEGREGGRDRSGLALEGIEGLARWMVKKKKMIGSDGE